MIKTGKVIYNLLSTNTGLTATIGTKIFPLVISENTELPAVTYERTYTNEYNRDSYISTSTFEINVLSDNYSQSIDIATQIDEILNNYQGENSGIFIKSIRNVAGNETFNEGVFVQRITYEVKE